MPADDLAGERIEPRQLVDFVAEQPDAKRVLLVRRHDLDDVAAHAEGAAPELHVVALVLDLDQLPEDLIAVDALPELERQQHAVVRLGRAKAVDAGDAGDDDDVAALEERPGGREAHPVDLVVDRRFLLDVRVGGGHVGFGLVVVVVADEVLDGVLRKEAPELLIQLGGERLVVRHHQRRAVHLRDGLRHRERLAGAGDAQQHLMRVAPVQPFDELGDSANLVALDLEVGDERESVVNGWHGTRMRRDGSGAEHRGSYPYRFVPVRVTAHSGAVLTERREVPAARADARSLRSGRSTRILTLRQRPSRLRVGGDVPKAVLPADLGNDLVVGRRRSASSNTGRSPGRRILRRFAPVGALLAACCGDWFSRKPTT